MLPLSVVAAALAGVCVAGSASRAEARPAAAPTQVRVAVTPYRFAMSREWVPRGPAVFTVVNRSKAVIVDFVINGVGRTPRLKPGQRYVLRVRFRDRGRFVYYSSLPEQNELGLFGVLVVR
jgi:hypothetical protein